MTDLERLAKEATDYGMSYGEYVTWKAMAIVQALAGIVSNINVTDCEGEEDEDDDDQI